MTFTPEEQAALDSVNQRDSNESDRDKRRKSKPDRERNGMDIWVWFWTFGVFSFGLTAWKWGDRLF